jgi:hypothetical protein
MSSKRDVDVDVQRQDRPIGGTGGEMLISGTFVRCAKCERDFRSTLTFRTLHDFERAATVGFIAQCPHCYAIFDCDRFNTYCEMASPADPAPEREVVPLPPRKPPEPR